MEPFLAILGLGPSELAIIVVVFVLLFGATKIPELARTLGRAKGDFEKGKREAEREIAADADRDALLAKARDLGIATEGRSIEQIRADVQAKSTQ